MLPTIPTLLALQAAGLAYGVVPLWRIARRAADLRAGAALALIVAYGASPTINNLNLADFHPSAVAVAPLLAATYTALRKQWGYFFLWSLATLIWSAELGLVIAGIGLLVFILGDRGPGTLIIVFGLAWAIVAVLVLEPRFGSTGFIAPGAFRAYGSNAFSIAGGMLIHPNRVLGDLFEEDNVRLIVGLLAPLLFLPVLAPRFLDPGDGSDRAVPDRGRGCPRQRHQRVRAAAHGVRLRRGGVRPQSHGTAVDRQDPRRPARARSRCPSPQSASSASTRSTRRTNGRGSGGGRTRPTTPGTRRSS